MIYPGSMSMNRGSAGTPYTPKLAPQTYDPRDTGTPDPTHPGQNIAVQFPPNMPKAPDFLMDYDPNSMSMLPGYQQAQAQNSQGFNKFRQEAMRTGASPFAMQAGYNQNQLATQAKDAAAGTGAAQIAAAESNLRSTGGLSNGARERAIEGGQKSNAMAMQDISRQNNNNQLQIGMNDEQNRIQQLSAIPGMEQAQLSGWEGVRQGDLQNQIGENQAHNQFNQNNYNQASDAAAANNTANAQAAAAQQAQNAPSLSNGFGLAQGFQNIGKNVGGAIKGGVIGGLLNAPLAIPGAFAGASGWFG